MGCVLTLKKYLLSRRGIGLLILLGVFGVCSVYYWPLLEPKLPVSFGEPRSPISGGLSFDRLRMSGAVKSGDFAPALGRRWLR